MGPRRLHPMRCQVSAQALMSLITATTKPVRHYIRRTRVNQVSDGVVVGSALVNQSAENVDTPDRIAPAVAAILADMRAAMDKQ